METVIAILAGAAAASVAAGGAAATKNRTWLKTKKGKIGLGLIVAGTLAGAAAFAFAGGIGVALALAGAFGAPGYSVASAGVALLGDGIGVMSGLVTGTAVGAGISYKRVEKWLTAPGPGPA
jgi:hypothetical protein